MSNESPEPPPDFPWVHPWVHHCLTRRQLLKGGAAALAGAALSGLPFSAGASRIYGGDDRLPDADRLRWFDTALGSVRSGNDVRELIDGPATFARFIEAIDTATGPDHFIYMAGWWFDHVFRLQPSIIGSSMFARLQVAADRGVELRALLWDQSVIVDGALHNKASADFINGLATGGAVLDGRHISNATRFFVTFNVGSHHQKLLVVNGEQGLIAFCGGIDINADRIEARGAGANAGGDTDGAPLHDIHCRVRGPAAWDLMRIFVERWDDQPRVAALPADRRGLKGKTLYPTVTNPLAGQTHYVQIGRTYGNGSAHDGIGAKGELVGYGFAPNGAQQCALMFLKAIAAATSFIYIEDQYFVDTTDQTTPGPLDVRRALRQALTDNADLRVLVLIPADAITSLQGQTAYRRSLLIRSLRAVGGNRVRMFVRSPAPAPHTYVHAKTWIFDDRFAIIGSANCNRRSWTHDSEIAAGIWDQGDADRGTRRLPHRLRMRQWAEHLNVDTLEKLVDPVESLKYWQGPDRPVGARVEEYDYAAAVTEPNASGMADWDQIVDPEGS